MDEGAARGRPRERDDEQILRAGLRAFGTQGYDGVSLRALNRELGASPAMLAKRFGTKEAFWTAAIDFGFARHRDLMLAELDALAPTTPLETLHGFVVAFLRTAAEIPELHQVVGIEAAVAGPRIDHLHDRFIAPLLRDVVRPVLDDLVERGEVRDVGDREIFFLVASGAAAVCAAGPLNARFDAHDGPFDLEVYAERVATLLVDALRVR